MVKRSGMERVRKRKQMGFRAEGRGKMERWKGSWKGMVGGGGEWPGMGQG